MPFDGSFYITIDRKLFYAAEDNKAKVERRVYRFQDITKTL